MFTGWINYRDYGGPYWDILAPQGIYPEGSGFLPVTDFETLEAAYKDICRQEGRIFVVATQGATWKPFRPNPSLSHGENIECLRALLTLEPS